MRLYNVSFDTNDKTVVLRPRIPESAGEGENKTIARICLADSIEHCMQAIAVGNRDIRVGAEFVVHMVDTSSLQVGSLITPERLVQRGLVPDALENNEYWYLSPVLSNRGVFRIENFDAEICLAWTCIEIEDCRRIVSKYLPDFHVNRYRNSRNLYEAAMAVCNEKHLWDIEDAIWDELAELPWAQKRELKHVVAKKLL